MVDMWDFIMNFQLYLQHTAVRWLLLAQPELVAVVLVVEDAGPRALVRRPRRRPVRRLRLGLRGGLHHLGRSLRGHLCLLGGGGGRGDGGRGRGGGHCRGGGGAGGGAATPGHHGRPVTHTGAGLVILGYLSVKIH